MLDDTEWMHEYVERRIVDTAALIDVGEYLEQSPEVHLGKLLAFEELYEILSGILKNRSNTMYKQLDKCEHSEVMACAACRINHMNNHIATVEAELNRLADARISFVEDKHYGDGGLALAFAIERAIDVCL